MGVQIHVHNVHTYTQMQCTLLILLTCFKQSATGTALADDNWPALHEVKVAEVSSLSVCVCIVRE